MVCLGAANLNSARRNGTKNGTKSGKVKNKALDVRYGFFFFAGFSQQKETNMKFVVFMEGPKDLEHTFLGGGSIPMLSMEAENFTHLIQSSIALDLPFAFLDLFGLLFLLGKDDFLTSKL